MALVPADEALAAPKPRKTAKRQRSPPKQPITAETWAAYSEAYEVRYGAAPKRNATVNGQLAQVVKRLGADAAPEVAAFYVGHNDAYYVRRMHAVGALLNDAEKLHTEWATGRRMTGTRARQADRAQTNFDVAREVVAELEREERQGEQW